MTSYQSCLRYCTAALIRIRLTVFLDLGGLSNYTLATTYLDAGPAPPSIRTGRSRKSEADQVKQSNCYLPAIDIGVIHTRVPSPHGDLNQLLKHNGVRGCPDRKMVAEKITQYGVEWISD